MPIPRTLEASFVALATDTTSLIAAERAAWKREDEVLGLQMTAMEETIALLQKEVKVTAAQLEPFTKGGAAPPSAESSREESSPARAAIARKVALSSGDDITTSIGVSQSFVLFDPNIFRSFRAQTPNLCRYFAPKWCVWRPLWVILALYKP